ncbi:MAG: methylated-DNA--[protein]-cysteine S-methyltransferase [Saprospiraceae bacterium]|jgi:methylated-DNA-[protein]-cysteine S-methyltransferase|nr:methylated-DNA--[protein]-cysteine S-methyltransferase [Saprospiraceae bacterium]
MDTSIDCFESPLGFLKITLVDDQLTKLEFSELEITDTSPNTPSKKIILQLKEYFYDGRKVFDIPLNLIGTNFQKEVWTELLNIKFGELISYKNIAEKLGDVKKIRAVGTANGANPIPIIIPCHRVIGSNNNLIGYSGGLWRKQWLIDHENGGLSGSLFDKL